MKINNVKTTASNIVGVRDAKKTGAEMVESAKDMVNVVGDQKGGYLKQVVSGVRSSKIADVVKKAKSAKL